MDTKVSGKEAPVPAAPVAPENEIPTVVIEEAPKPKLFSFDSLEKVKGVIAKIQGVAEKIQKNLEKLDEQGKLKSKKDCEEAKVEIAAATAQFLQSHPEASDPKANGAAKKTTLAFLNSETKFSLLPYDQQLSFLKGEPLHWADAEVKAAVKPAAGGWKESRLRFSLSLKLEAKALEEEGRLDEAAQFYHSASMFAPQDIGLHADAARLLKAQSDKTKDPALKKQQAESAEKHLEAVADEMQVGRIDTLIGKGKLDEADKLAEQIKGEFFLQLNPAQRKVLEGNPKIRARLLEVNVYQAEIADRQGKHDKAVDIYQRYLKHVDKLIVDAPKYSDIYLLRAKIHHGLGDYGGALQDYKTLGKQSPEDAGYAESYRQDLQGLAKQYSAEWHLAEAMGDSGKANVFLLEELKVRQALGDEAGVKELSPKLAALSKEMSFDKLMAKAQEFAGEAHLSPLNASLKDLAPYLKYSPKANDKGYQLEFTDSFKKLDDAKKLEVLQRLHLEGFLSLNKSLAAKETDPAKKNYYEGKVQLLEGNLPAARLKLMEFKALSKDSKDPEVLKMREEAGLVLRQLNLAALNKLGEWQGALDAQRHSSLVTVAATVTDDKLSARFQKESPRLIAALKYYLENGKADTIDEALEAIQADNLKAMDDFQKDPTVKTGMKITYSRWVAAGKTSAEIKIKGGTLDLGNAAVSDTQYPDKLKVVIGPEGGCIKTDTYAYVFPPGKGTKEVVISGGKLKPGNLKELIYDPTRLANEEDKQKDFIRTSYKHEPEFLWANSAEFHPGDPETLRLVAEHGKNLAKRDQDLFALFRLETKAGLQQTDTPDKKRAALLEAAKEIRHRTGSYAVAGEILEGLFAKDLEAAMKEIPADKLQEVKKEVEADRPKVEKQVKAELEKMKEKHPADYQKRFPKGAPSDADIKQMVDQSLAGKFSIKVRKLAFERIDAKADQGGLSDPIATEAWKIYDDMKDPTDKTWNLADESWDGIVDEVVITAVTMPVTMGAGAVVRGTLGGTSLALNWIARGGGRALAMRAGIFLGGAVTEGFMMEAFTPGEFQGKNVGFNTLMSIAFHGGGKGWGKVSAKLGLDEAALFALRSEGKSVAGKSVLNAGGGIFTQASVATTMGYAGDLILNHDNPNTFWERFGAETFRMLAFHYGTHSLNMATGNLGVESDQALQVKMKEVRESYLKLVEKGVPKEDAAKQAVDYAKSLKIDVKVGEAHVELHDQDLKIESPTLAPEKKAPPPLKKTVTAKPEAAPKGESVAKPVAPKPEVAAKPAAPKPEAVAKSAASPKSPKIQPIPSVSEVVVAQTKKARELGELGAKRGLVDANAAQRLPKELEAFTKSVLLEAEKTLKEQEPSPEQQKKKIPLLAEKNAENFLQRYGEELGLKKEAGFKKKLTALLAEGLEGVAKAHNEKLPSFELSETPSAAPEKPAKPAASPTEVSAKLKDYSAKVRAEAEAWAKSDPATRPPREEFLRKQIDGAAAFGEGLGKSEDPSFRKTLVNLVVGELGRAETMQALTKGAAPANDAAPEAAAAFQKKAPVEKPASPAEGSAAGPTPVLDVDRLVVESGLLAKEVGEHPEAFQKDLVRATVVGFHELRKWIEAKHPSPMEIAEQVRILSEGLGKKLGVQYGGEGKNLLAKRVETLIRDRLREDLGGTKAKQAAKGSDTLLTPPPPLEVVDLVPDTIVDLPKRGEFLDKMQTDFADFILSVQGSLKGQLEKSAGGDSIFSGVFGDKPLTAKPNELVLLRNLFKLNAGLKKRLLDFAYDHIHRAEVEGPEALSPAKRAELAKEVVRLAEEFGMAHEDAFVEPLKKLLFEKMEVAAQGFAKEGPAAKIPKADKLNPADRKLRRAFLDKIFEARAEYAPDPEGKPKATKPRAFEVKPVRQASQKLDAIFTMLEGRLMEEPTPELFAKAEALGKDIDTIIHEDPAKVGAEHDLEMREQKEAAVARLEKVLRNLDAHPEWPVDQLLVDYGQPPSELEGPKTKPDSLLPPTWKSGEGLPAAAHGPLGAKGEGFFASEGSAPDTWFDHAPPTESGKHGKDGAKASSAPSYDALKMAVPDTVISLFEPPESLPLTRKVPSEVILKGGETKPPPMALYPEVMWKEGGEGSAKAETTLVTGLSEKPGQATLEAKSSAPLATPEGASEPTAGTKLGVANFKSMPEIEAKADKIAKAKPSPERISRYTDYLMKKKGLTREAAEAQAKQWAEQVILDARNKQVKQTHIYDTSLPAKPETAHLDKATIDHHGRFGNPKNATEQLLDRLEATLETLRGDKKALEAAKQDKAAMQAAGGDPLVAAALKELGLKEVTTDNLADGGWCVWIAKHQAKVLKDPKLRKLIADATHFEDFTAFGTEYNSKDPGVRLQAALFQKYGEILKAHGVVGSDRMPPEKAQQMMGEALAAIDQMVSDPVAREAAAQEFFQKVEAGKDKAAAQALMGEPSVHQGETNLSFFDLTKLGDFTVFQQWLALPRVEPSPGNPDSLQVSVVPMKPVTAADGSAVPKTLQIVAIPNGRELPSGKGLLSVLEKVNAAEKAKAERLGVEPNFWFGKDNVILPNPMKGGTLLTPKEVSAILTSPELGLFHPNPIGKTMPPPKSKYPGGVDSGSPSGPVTRKVAPEMDSARRAEVASAFVVAYEDPKNPIHGDPEYQASYQAAKDYLAAHKAGKPVPQEAKFVDDYQWQVKSEKSSGIVVFAGEATPAEKRWTVSSVDPKTGAMKLVQAKTGKELSVEGRGKGKHPFGAGDAVEFHPSVGGASDGAWRAIMPASGSDTIIIGRDPTVAGHVVSHEAVSRRHCSIQHSPEGWYVADLKSTNGLYLNGQKVEGSAWIRKGDVLSTKDTKGQFHILGVFQPPEAPAEPKPVTAPSSPPKFDQSEGFLHGDVDLKNPTVHQVSADESGGSASAVTTQGDGYGKKNEDNVLVLRGKEGTLLLDTDGMGGHGHGDLAAYLTAEAFKVEMKRSGDTEASWQLANLAVRVFNGEFKKSRNLQSAILAGKKVIDHPELADQLPTAGGAGAVSVAVKIHPPKDPGGVARVEFSWVGDARAVMIERGPDGKWQWVYRTVDEGLPGMPGYLQPGVDFEMGGKKRTLRLALDPQANIVTNGLGLGDHLVIKKTSDGEFPDPTQPTGTSLAGEGYQGGIAIKPGQMILAGSDGFWEQFGSTREVLDLIQYCKTAEEARDVLSHEAHQRMKILGEARDWLRDPVKNPAGATRYPFEHHGQKLFIDKTGAVYEQASGGEAVNHYKTDNFSLITYLHDPKAGGAVAPKVVPLAPAPQPLPAAAHSPMAPMERWDSGPQAVKGVPPLAPPPAFTKAPLEPASTKAAVEWDAKNFNSPGVKDIPGLTPELEMKFLRGDTIEDHTSIGLGFQEFKQGSGAGTVSVGKSTQADFEVYQKWKVRMGFQKVAAKDAVASHELREYGKARGLEIKSRSRYQDSEDWSISGHQAAYLQGILAKLPSSLLNAKSADGTPYLKGIVLGADRVKAAEMSAFDAGYVHLYRGVLVGPRRNFLGLVLHEIGHSVSERYQLSGPPDAQVSPAMRAAVNAAVKKIVAADATYALDWAGGKEFRKDYTAQFDEFMAEFTMQYVVDGEGLRKHIAGISDPAVKQAYQGLYQEIKKTVFIGYEYRDGVPIQS
ncbi:MAG: FHA domain-containing protein [bacterium]